MGSAPRLTAQQVQRASEDYRSGATLDEIAATVNVSPQTVALRLKATGVTMRRQSPTEEQVDQMIQLYTEGSSLATVGAVVGYDPGTVANHVRSRGVRIRDSHGRTR